MKLAVDYEKTQERGKTVLAEISAADVGALPVGTTAAELGAVADTTEGRQTLAESPELTKKFVADALAALRAFGTPDTTGVVDMTALLQAAVNATPEGGTLTLPAGTFRLTAPLVISRSIRVIGAGVFALGEAYGVGGAFDSPSRSPHLGGTVFAQTAAATDAIRITGSAVQVDLADFGIRFDGAHRFSNTGHGIFAQSATAFNSGSEHGLFHSTWENISVFGHDGNHYAFKAVNPLHCVTRKLRSYGGGGVHWTCDSYAGNYGNTTFDSPFVHVFAPGTAHGYFIEGRTSSGASGVMNLVTFLRPQCNSSVQTTRYGVAATSAQYLFLAKSGSVSVSGLTVIAPDFETTVGGKCDFGTGSHFIDPSGIFGEPADVASKTFTVMRSTTGAKVLNSDMTLSNKNTPNPTVAVGSAAGAGATANISGDDEVGTVTLVTGTGTGTFGALFTVSFGRLSSAATAVMLTARNGSAGKIRVYIANRTATGWVVNAADLAADASANLQWDYHVIR